MNTRVPFDKCAAVVALVYLIRILFSKQLIPVAGGKNGAREDENAAADLEGSGDIAEGNSQDDRPGRVGNVERHASGRADLGDGLVVEEVRCHAGECRKGDGACRHGGCRLCGKSPCSEYREDD